MKLFERNAHERPREADGREAREISGERSDMPQGDVADCAGYDQQEHHCGDSQLHECEYLVHTLEELIGYRILVTVTTRRSRSMQVEYFLSNVKPTIHTIERTDGYLKAG